MSTTVNIYNEGLSELTEDDDQAIEPDIRCKAAVTLFENHLSGLPHPKYLIKLVQFSHDSPGLRVYKRHIAQALVHLLESNGFYVFNGLTEASAAIEAMKEL